MLKIIKKQLKSAILISIILLLILLAFNNSKLEAKDPTVSVEMVLVEAGTAADGITSISYDIKMGKYEVTHAQFIKFLNSVGVDSDGIYQGKKVMDKVTDCAVVYDGSFYFAGSDYADSEDTPVTELTWYGALAYCNWLSEQEGLTPAYDLINWELKDEIQNLEGYRLPTETEHKYAMQGGKDGKETIYAGSNNIDEVAWYGEAWSSGSLHPVGEKKANELGIYDMSGNAWEWTNTPAGRNDRVIRGGSWNYSASSCEVDSSARAGQGFGSLIRGFRLVKMD